MEKRLAELFGNIFKIQALELQERTLEQMENLSLDTQGFPALIELARPPNAPRYRQLAASLLRRTIPGCWSILAPEHKEILKTFLIESIKNDDSAPLRRASANVARLVAKYTDEWPELQSLIFELGGSPQQNDREVASIIFSSLPKTTGSTSHFEEMRALLLKEQETSRHVKIAYLKSALESSHEAQEVDGFREFVFYILDLSNLCFCVKKEDLGLVVSEIHYELIETRTLLLEELVQSIVSISITVGTITLAASEALKIIRWLIDHKFDVLIKHNLFDQIVLFLCKLVEKSIYYDSDDEDSPKVQVLRFLETIAVDYPAHVFPLMLGFASLHLFGLPSLGIPKSLNPIDRRAGIRVLTVLRESSCVGMMQNLKSAVEIICEAFRDPNELVKRDAVHEWQGFTSDFKFAIASHYHNVFPCILDAFKNTDGRELKEIIFCELAMLCERMGKKILPFSETILRDLHAGREIFAEQSTHDQCMSAIAIVVGVLCDEIISSPHRTSTTDVTEEINYMEIVKGYLPELIRVVLRLKQEQDEGLRPQDYDYDSQINNVAFAIARMIEVYPEPIPFNEELPSLVKILCGAMLRFKRQYQ